MPNTASTYTVKHSDRFTYRLYPVGQGLFSAGFLHQGLCKQPSFTWVYDCGTLSPDAVNLKPFEDDCSGRQNIDLLVISHYHLDHFSSIPKLLSRFTVKDIILPYQPLDERLWSAFAQNVALNPQAMNFLIRPIQYLRELRGGAQARFSLFMAPWQEFGDDVHSLDQDPPSIQSSRECRIMNSGTQLTFGDNWEFVPLRNDSPSDCDASFRALVHEHRDSLVSGGEGRAETLGKLREIYEKKRLDAKATNSASIMLYAGPQSAFRPHALAINASISKGKRVCYSENSDECNFRKLAHLSRPGVLHTGDARLVTEQDWKLLRERLGDRLTYVGAFQVPHHGSDENFDNPPPDLRPHAYVISCGAGNPYGHPSPRVVALTEPYILSESGDFEESWCLLTLQPSLIDWLAEQVVNRSLQSPSNKPLITIGVAGAIRKWLEEASKHECVTEGDFEEKRRCFLIFFTRNLLAVCRQLHGALAPMERGPSHTGSICPTEYGRCLAFLCEELNR